MTMKQDPRFAGIEPFTSKIWLASPTMHGDEQKWVDEAIRTNWVSTVGENIDEVERQIAAYIGCNCVVGLSCGTAALHLAIRLAGEKLYGIPKVSHGSLEGHRVFASDMTFDATVNPITYEGGEPVFIDTETDTWNMDPKALEKAFEIYPDVKLIVVAHLYGTPGKIDEIRAIADKHGALIVEDAAESLGAAYKGKQTGTFGDYSVISFNGNKIITGSAGGTSTTTTTQTTAATETTTEITTTTAEIETKMLDRIADSLDEPTELTSPFGDISDAYVCFGGTALYPSVRVLSADEVQKLSKVLNSMEWEEFPDKPQTRTRKTLNAEGKNAVYIMRDFHTISREEGDIMKETKPQIRSSFKAQSREELSRAVTKKIEKIITEENACELTKHNRKGGTVHTKGRNLLPPVD